MKSWRVLAGFLISAGFIAYALRGQDFSAIRDALTKADYRYLLPAVALYLIGVWVRALRWKLLLRPVLRASTTDLAPVVAVGFMANNVLPLRTGELVRSYALSRRYGVRKTAALATIAVERLFDGLTLLGFILASATVVSLTSAVQHIALVAFILFAGVLIGFFLLTLGGDLRDRLLQIVVGPLPTPVADRVERMAESFFSGLGVLRRKSDLASVAATSVVAWLFEASMYWTLARAFGGGLADAIGVPQTLLTTGVANLATLIPSSPGYVGPFESGVILVLNGALGEPREIALSYAILVHAALFFPVTIWGAIEWWRQQFSLQQIRELNGNAAQPAAPPVAAERVPSGVAGSKAPRPR
ncbi:MAG TPA: lysylphosphatidylglycerol synthase transmembrane domain-containing protein [Thermomicrobiales bacterium]